MIGNAATGSGNIRRNKPIEAQRHRVFLVLRLISCRDGEADGLASKAGQNIPSHFGRFVSSVDWRGVGRFERPDYRDRSYFV